ncbi:hypothetical protein [Enterovibrio norvegicus]|uniref:hypothetical protein n=1 Tax=Enterovibrio norvegicus TaxID=188144 RepID=UPI000C817BC6|nr:hypothetical protein [Enterovibrio norvegicus]PMH64504.1 hypothetical protein BCU62_15735 [Enterovibrio norvegicus]
MRLNENEIKDDSSTSFWLRDQIAKSKKRDVVNALHDAQVLVGILESRLQNISVPFQATLSDLRAKPSPTQEDARKAIEQMRICVERCVRLTRVLRPAGLSLVCIDPHRDIEIIASDLIHRTLDFNDPIIESQFQREIQSLTQTISREWHIAELPSPGRSDDLKIYHNWLHKQATKKED